MSKDEFEFLTESIYASTASSLQGGGSRAPLGVELRDALNESYKAHDT